MNISNNNTKERYEFCWAGKKESFDFSKTSPVGKLIPDKKGSKDWDTTNNLYIEGDCLEVLKHLDSKYHGKIKMIYIDPPYNTGHDFVYKDDFKLNKKSYKKLIGENGQIAGMEGRFHTNWLNMMYPALLLARKLLNEDGIIFISIGDSEVKNMENICDEVFGEKNFITRFIFEKTQHYGRQKLNTYSNAEYILCYAKKLYDKKIKELLVERISSELLDAPLYNASNRPAIPKFPAGAVSFKIKDGIYKKTTSADYELLSPVKIKNSKNENEFELKFRSRWSSKKIMEEFKKGTTYLVKTQTFAIRAVYSETKTTHIAPRQIIFTNEKNPYCTKSRFGEKVNTNENATKDLEQIMRGKYFSYPKPVSLIKYLMSLLYDYKENKFEENFIVLDFFSGSAATAAACIELNAQDGGNRQFIMVQIPEKTDKGTEAYKAGYKTICDIGKERIRRTGENIKKKIEAENELAKVEQPRKLPDVGFKAYKLVL